MKKQEGITLIALVITIIVLLILAGVTIAMLTGENGLLTRASGSTAVQQVATGKDYVSLAVQEGITVYYENKYSDSTGATSYANVKAAIDAKLTAAASAADTNVYTIDTTNTKVIAANDSNIYSTYTITNDGKLTWADHFSQ